MLVMASHIPYALAVTVGETYRSERQVPMLDLTGRGLKDSGSISLPFRAQPRSGSWECKCGRKISANKMQCKSCAD